MILLRDFDKEKKLDRVWYDSSNIIYSECEDNNDLKTLKVVFKKGLTYLYKKVDTNDYVMFVHGGLDGSNGKALNQFIKPKCEYERIEDTDLVALNEELERMKSIEEEKKKVRNS